MIRHLLVLLLAAPALLASALAAERAAPAPTTRPCPEFGPGFVRAAGSGTCVRVGGRVSAEAGTATRPGLAAGRPALGATGRVDIDTRTETDYGPARTFVRIGGGRRLPQ